MKDPDRPPLQIEGGPSIHDYIAGGVAGLAFLVSMGFLGLLVVIGFFVQADCYYQAGKKMEEHRSQGKD